MAEPGSHFSPLSAECKFEDKVTYVTALKPVLYGPRFCDILLVVLVIRLVGFPISIRLFTRDPHFPVVPSVLENVFSEGRHFPRGAGLHRTVEHNTFFSALFQRKTHVQGSHPPPNCT